MYRNGAIKKKILLLLQAGVALGFAYTPYQRYKTFRDLGREWERINYNSLRNSINSLYKSKMIDLKEKDGTIEMILLDKGKKRSLAYKMEEMKINIPEKWDGKWRMVLFDIPKHRKKDREALRFHLKRLGFYQYQKSVFIFPYNGENEIDFLIEFYQLRPYARQLLVSNLDNEIHLKDIFKRRKILS